MQFNDIKSTHKKDYLWLKLSSVYEEPIIMCRGCCILVVFVSGDICQKGEVQVINVLTDGYIRSYNEMDSWTKCYVTLLAQKGQRVNVSIVDFSPRNITEAIEVGHHFNVPCYPQVVGLYFNVQCYPQVFDLAIQCYYQLLPYGDLVRPILQRVVTENNI